MDKFCRKCGSPIDEGAVFCDNCGTKLGDVPNGNTVAPQSAEPVKKKKNGVVIGVVAVLVLAALAAVIVLVILPKSRSESEVKGTDTIIAPETDTTALTTAAEPETEESITEPAVNTEEPPEPDMPEALPDFEKYGIALNIEPGKTFDVVTEVRDSGDMIIGKGKLVSFTREPVSQEIVDFMNGEGADVSDYEVLRVSFAVEYSGSMLDRNTMTFKGKHTRMVTDYYNMDLFDASARTLTDSEGEKYYCRDIISNGETKTYYFWLDSSADIDGDTLYYRDDRTFLVPAGYDGVVCGYRDVRITDARIYDNYNEGQYRFIRLIGGEATN